MGASVDTDKKCTICALEESGCGLMEAYSVGAGTIALGGFPLLAKLLCEKHERLGPALISAGDIMKEASRA